MSKSNGKTAAERNEEYLQRLENKNRLKKNLSTKKLSDRIAEDREKGFSTHFAGANASESKKPTISAVKPITVLNAATVLPTANASKFLDKEAQSPESSRKRGWVHAPQKTKSVLQGAPVPVKSVIKTEEGDFREDSRGMKESAITDVSTLDITNSSGLLSVSRVVHPNRNKTNLEQQLEERNEQDFSGDYCDDFGDDYGDDDFEDDLDVEGIDEESTNERDDKRLNFSGEQPSTPKSEVAEDEDEEGDFHDSIDLLHSRRHNSAPLAAPRNLCSTVCSPLAARAATSSCDHAGLQEARSTPPGYHSSDAEDPQADGKVPIIPYHDRGATSSLRKSGDDEEKFSELALQLKALDPAKQSQLLAMLQQMESGGTGAGGRMGEAITTDPHHRIETQPSQHLRGKGENTALLPAGSEKPGSLDYPKNGSSTLNDTAESNMVQRSRSQPSVPTNPALLSSTIKIRIKVHNSWEKTKFASLSAVRLCVRGSNIEIPLSDFNVQVTSGNDLLPKTGEVSRTVAHLFRRSRVRQQQDWSFPMIRDRCMQLELRGDVGVEIALLEDLELAVWNGNGDVNKGISAAMDMDIYFGNKCIWTGSLDKIEQNVASVPSIEHSSDFENVRLLLDHRGIGREPSIIAALSPSKSTNTSILSDSKKVTISNQIQSEKRIQLESTTAFKVSNVSYGNNTSTIVPLLGFSGMSTASTDGRSLSGVSHINSSNNSSSSSSSNNHEPSWFSDLKTPRSEVILSSARDEILSAVDEGGNVHCSSSARTKGEGRRSIKDRHPVAQTTQYGKREYRARGRAEEDKLEPAVEQQGTRAVATVAPRRASRRQQQRMDEVGARDQEASLRQSLEALDKSDRRLRGRLESELQASVNSSTIVNQDDAVYDERYSTSTNAANSNFQLPNPDFRHLEICDGVLSTEVEKQTLLRQRASRIDEVQETVSSALQNLAGVLSTLALSGRSAPRHSPIQLSPHSATEPLGASVDDDNVLLAALHNEIEAVVYSDELSAPRCQVAPSESALESSQYEIPELPSGKVLKIDILSTWGDPYYVGLNGIDCFDLNGEVLTLGHGISSITSVPRDINDLPEYKDDPRTVSNLLDEINFTRDDLHVWLAPHGHTLAPPLPLVASVTIDFTDLVLLSLVRIWNYNKSRTHCFRGVRRARMTLDMKVIFEGEIRMAPGLITSSDDCSEVILFSTDCDLLEKISLYDVEMGYRINDEDSTNTWIEAMKVRHSNFRPPTSDGHPSPLPDRKLVSHPHQVAKQSKSDAKRPFTAAREEALDRDHTCGEEFVGKNMSSSQGQSLLGSSRESPSFPASARSMVRDSAEQGMLKMCVESVAATCEMMLQDRDLVTCQVLTLSFESSWGDKCYIGLCGLEVTLGCSSITAELGPEAVDASPRDLSAIGVFDDPRVPENLVNDFNDTTDDKHMWLIPYTAGGKHELRIDMGSTCKLSGFNVWNYNKSQEDTLRGVRLVTLFGDGNVIGQQELRIAPGCDGVAYKQHICFRDVKKNVLRRKQQGAIRYVTPSLRQDYEPPFDLSGMLWKIDIYSNWGDGYYVGLDGLQFLDSRGNPIDLQKLCTISSSPHMWDLEISKNDPRVPGNLALDPGDCSTAWLAPLAQSVTRAEQMTSVARLQPKQSHCKPPSSNTGHDAYFYDHNVLFVMFDQPVNVSVIRFFNYGKSPTRGVKDFGIEVDHRTVYMGRLQRREVSETSAGHSDGEVVVFSNDPTLTRIEKSKVTYCGATDQDVLCINDRKVIIRSKNMYEAPSVASEGIHSDLSKRPTTAALPHGHR